MTSNVYDEYHSEFRRFSRISLKGSMYYFVTSLLLLCISLKKFPTYGYITKGIEISVLKKRLHPRLSALDIIAEIRNQLMCEAADERGGKHAAWTQ